MNIMKHFSLLFLFLITFNMCGGDSSQAENAPAFKAKEPTVVEYINWLESHSFEKNKEEWQKKFNFVADWVTNCPYIKVVIHGDYFPALIRATDSDANAATLTLMYLLGNTRYLIQNPKESSESNQAIKASFQCIVNHYDMLKKESGYNLAVVEDYKTLLDRNLLDQHIANVKKRRTPQ